MLLRPFIAFRATLWLLLLGNAFSLHAHQPGLSYLNVAVTNSTITGRLDMALRDLEFAVGLDADGNGSVTYDELLGRQSAIAGYVAKQVKFRADGQPAPLRVTEHQVAADQDGVYAVVVFQVDGPKTPHTLEIDCRLFFGRDPQHRCLMQLEYQGEPRMAVFRSNDTAQTFELIPVTGWERFREFTGEGIHHIWTGYDHMLFLIALLLPAVLRSESGRWEAAERFRPVFINVFKIVTAFTIAHSITLSLATLKLVSLPTRLVESTIAASVAVAALNNLWPLFRDRGWLVAFSFGLMHGFGFASALSVLNLESGTLALALVSFNIGVEAGQLAVVALFLPVAFALRSQRFYHEHLLRWGSAVIMLMACVWLVERLAN